MKRVIFYELRQFSEIMEIIVMDFLKMLNIASISTSNPKFQPPVSYSILKFRPRGNFWPDLARFKLVVTFLLTKISS